MIFPSESSAASFNAFYHFANTSQVNVSSGYGFTAGFETSQSFTSGSSISIMFPDSDDGLWCRTPGALSVYGVTDTPVDLTSTSWAIDAALPGIITATCTQGSGVSSYDTITIGNITTLNGSVTYGFEVMGNIGVLGTASTLGGHTVNVTLTDGISMDSSSFILQLTSNHSVTITATVLPMPQCSNNSGCPYPLLICDGLQQCSPCTSNAQCYSGDICVSGQCVRDMSCNNNGDCFYGNEICGPGNLCQPCSNSSQCYTGDQCISGVCQTIPPFVCTVNSQCNYRNEVCVGGSCIPCTSSSQCSGNDICSNGSCIAPPPLECSNNVQCNYPYEICTAGGSCDQCLTDWQCSFGDACVNGTCTPVYECLTNNDCRFPDEICTLSNQCEPCTMNAQCGAGNSCINGRCEAIPPAQCTSNSQCNYPDFACVNSICQQCTSDSQCSGVDICVAGKCEPFPPAECSVNSHCNYPVQVCVNNSCGACTADSQCNFGNVCSSGVCVARSTTGISSLIPVEAQRMLAQLSSAVNNSIEVVTQRLSDMRYNGNVATTVSLVTSISVGMGLLNFALLDTLMLLIRGIFGLLTLFGIRTKGEPYGYVYDSISKDPISNAMVRIFEIDSDTNGRRLVETSVTDAFGLFNASLKPGTYYMSVSKSGYQFPSRIVSTITDYPIEKVYHGDPFTFTSENEVYYSIPMDPTKQGTFQTVSAIIRGRFSMFARVAQLALLIFGGSLSLYMFITYPGIFNTIILLFYIPGIIFTIYTIAGSGAKYGYVKDTHGNPIADLTLGLYDTKEERLITKRVTDKDGRFRFVSAKGEYNIVLIDAPYKIVKEDKVYLKVSGRTDYIVIVGNLELTRNEGQASV